MEEAPLLPEWVTLLYIMPFSSRKFHHVALLFILSLEVLVYAGFSWASYSILLHFK
jgi:hypothetical protein